MTNVVTQINRDFYKILLVSLSGKGKTFSFRNMPKESTGFINAENKPLPFKNEFKHHSRTTSAKDTYNALIEFGKNPEIEAIVLDSFSAYADQVLKDARATKKGFDIWNYYNDEIGKMLDMIKRVPKEVFVTAHYEILNIEGSPEKRIKVKGKEWEGLIEKEFTIVLYADAKVETGKRPEYMFNLFVENSSSKCPPGIFGEEVLQIPNDSKFILDKIKEFVS
jgi:hypothetical protein